MPYKDPSTYKSYQTAYRLKTREARNERQRLKRRLQRGSKTTYEKRTGITKREWYNAVKLRIGCLNPNCCWQGPFKAYMLDFHHTDPSTKVGPVSQMLDSRTKCKAEMLKCTVLCAICHRQVTWGELDDTMLPKCKIEDLEDK